jgi:Asp-tRNA(Asn)/Glu-tRNA(Gln) amidotransferase A subunit family amidase
MALELHELTPTQAASAMGAGNITAEKLAISCLQRIAAREDTVHAWAYLDRDLVIEHARACDRTPRRSKLHGIPIGVKDVIDTVEQPTAYNSPIYTGYRPRSDASSVAQIKRAGGFVFGKTVTAEFANIHPGPTRNPHHPGHTPGGSSSGSAAAVADYMVPAALGTQTAGSVIRPAAYCGVFALKPSFGSINRAGIKFVAESLDTIGLFARSIDDLIIVLEVLSGKAPCRFETSKPRIGLCRTRYWDRADGTAQRSFETAAERLTQKGADVAEFVTPSGVDELSERRKVVMGYESARALAWEYANFPDQLSDELRERLDEGWKVSRADYDAVCEDTSVCLRRLTETMQDIDFLLTLSAPGEAPSSLTRTGDSLFNRTCTLLGNPCASIPFGNGPNGLPLGVQLIGARGADTSLLTWASWANSALNEDN